LIIFPFKNTTISEKTYLNNPISKYPCPVYLTAGTKLHITKMVYTKTLQRILKIFFPDICWIVKPTDVRAVYLTFDDGPDPEITPWVLETLEARKARATFFCLVKNVEAYPGIYENIRANGHSVGIHGYEHFDGWKTSTKKYMDNLEKGASLIDSKLFRPPFGRISLLQYLKIRKKYQIVMWDIMPGDFREDADPAKMLEYIIRNLKNGSIITLHDNQKSKANLKVLLPSLLDYLVQQQFQLKILKEF
jgi:peptidoglycan-N-acetylglucosamine deacetylase